MDVTSRADICEAFSRAISTFGCTEVASNNAGLFEIREIETEENEEAEVFPVVLRKTGLWRDSFVILTSHDFNQ
ncbi:hypothetical protein BDZ89DRAFT_1069301 [Hymenopellis radicata]|nr:hypothetical protein BDZ89DRAFT_1069301 [Hymenopellis radicata]